MLVLQKTSGMGIITVEPQFRSGVARPKGRVIPRRFRGFGDTTTDITSQESATPPESIPADIYNILYPSEEQDDVYNEELYEGYGRAKMARPKVTTTRVLKDYAYGQADATATTTTTPATVTAAKSPLKKLLIMGALVAGGFVLCKYVFKSREY
jgi:hypothetical protein